MTLLSTSGIQNSAFEAFLQNYISLERYITSVQDYLPTFLGTSSATQDENDVASQAHSAMHQQLQQQAPQLVSGINLMQVLNNTRLLPVDSGKFDELLLGGVRETCVTEVSGETATGKTQLCHLAAVTTAKRNEAVLYFDSTNAFSATRARQLLLQMDASDAVQGALSNITVVCCHSIHALLASLDQLATQAANSDPKTWPKLLIVDSISALLSPVIGSLQHNQGHVIVAETGRMLRHIAHQLQLAVLVTNHVVGTGSFGSGVSSSSNAGFTGSGWQGPQGINPGYKPALGEQWRGVPHARVQLSKAAGDVVVATLLNHGVQAPGQQAVLHIGERITSEP